AAAEENPDAHESDSPPAETPGELDVLPTILSAPAPSYPKRAIRLGQEGAVTCRILVDATGIVKSVSVAESSGHRLLDEAAIAAVQTWSFAPGRLAGLPAERELRHIVRFELTL
ncbi:MAG: energy transducer TonB, partial [Planctomycetota bacterium]